MDSRFVVFAITKSIQMLSRIIDVDFYRDKNMIIYVYLCIFIASF